MECRLLWNAGYYGMQVIMERRFLRNAGYYGMQIFMESRSLWNNETGEFQAAC